MEYHNPKGVRWPWPCEKHDVCVIYVARYQDSIENYIRFMSSLERQRGIEFGLFIVYKGFPDIETMKSWHYKYCTHPDFTSTMMGDYGYDLTAYRVGASCIRNNILVFFNSSSDLVNENCIQRLVAGLDHVDVCGCFGSWETFNKSWLSRLFWPAFPNPHIRTNAFAIRNSDFMRVWPARFRTKFGCHKWESGKKGFSTRLKIGVADRYFDITPPEFFDVCGFRFSHSLLLCHDNMTRKFDALSPVEQQQLYDRTWKGHK